MTDIFRKWRPRVTVYRGGYILNEPIGGDTMIEEFGMPDIHKPGGGRKKRLTRKQLRDLHKFAKVIEQFGGFDAVIGLLKRAPRPYQMPDIFERPKWNVGRFAMPDIHKPEVN